MIVLGLTGSIGMGKSTAAAVLRRMRIPVHDADAVVHDLLGPGGAAVAGVLDFFPDCGDGRSGIDRRKLGDAVFADLVALGELEAIVHPMVRARENVFLRLQQRRRASLVVLDIPLLFETHAETRCDAVAVVSAPAHLQRLRVLRRAGMTENKLDAILAAQMPDTEKRRRADFVIQTGLDKHRSLRAIEDMVKTVKRKPRAKQPPAWPPRSNWRNSHA